MVRVLRAGGVMPTTFRSVGSTARRGSSPANDPFRVSYRVGRYGVHLDELAVVAEGGNAEKRAGGIVLGEGVTHDLPRRVEIALRGGGHVDRGTDDVVQGGARVSQADPEIHHCLRCLSMHIAHGGTVCVERTSAYGQDQACDCFVTAA